jgi:hypothetical protein
MVRRYFAEGQTTRSLKRANESMSDEFMILDFGFWVLGLEPGTWFTPRPFQC